MSAPHLLHVFSTFVPAGPELRTVRLIGALGPEYRHSIVAVDGRTSAAGELPPDAPARVLTAPPRAGTPRTVRAFARLFRAERPDLVLTYNWGAFDAVIAARLGRRPLVHHEDGFNADEATRFKRRRELFRRLLLPGARRVVVPSERLRQIALERWRLPAQRVALVPNGIDPARFAPTGAAPDRRAELGIPPEAIVVGFVGHLRPVKNPVRLLRALCDLGGEREVHALVLGDGEERARVEQLAQRPELAGRVHLVGHQPDTAAWYGAMDLFAISSDSEQMPVALLEAMAAGLPVVSTDVGDVARMLPPEEAPFVVPISPVGTAAELGRAVRKLAHRPDLRRELGRANRERVEERFTFAGMLDAYRRIYREALAGR